MRPEGSATSAVADAERRCRAMREVSLIAKARYLQLMEERFPTAEDLLQARTLWRALEAECDLLERSLGGERGEARPLAS